MPDTGPPFNLPYPDLNAEPNVPRDIEALARAVARSTAQMPVGTVVAYAGKTAPEGWLVCDGAPFNATTYAALNTVLGVNQTPNLVERFVKGVGAGYGGSRTGGSKTITVQQLPSHNHGGTTASGNAAHSHAGTTAVSGSHQHGLNYTQVANAKASGSVSGVVRQGAAVDVTFPDGNHAHTFTTDQQNAPHTHGIPAQGGGQDYEPPFYALVYIIKAV